MPRWPLSRGLSLAGGDPARFDVEGVSAALLGAFDGLAQQAMVDPSFDLPRAYRALADAFIALLREAAGRRLLRALPEGPHGRMICLHWQQC